MLPKNNFMTQTIIGGLLSTPAPTAPIIGIAFIVLFAIVGVIVGPDYDGMNAPSLSDSKESNDNWSILTGIAGSLKFIS